MTDAIKFYDETSNFGTPKSSLNCDDSYWLTRNVLKKAINNQQENLHRRFDPSRWLLIEANQDNGKRLWFVKTFSAKIARVFLCKIKRGKSKKHSIHFPLARQKPRRVGLHTLQNPLFTRYFIHSGRNEKRSRGWK